MRNALLRTVGISLLAVALSGCGGAGSGVEPIGGAPPTPPAPPPPPPPVPPPPPPPPPPAASGFDTPEYQNSRGAAQANAIRAYEKGATGKDITVAVIDTSFVPANAVQFAGRIHPASTDVVASRGLYGGSGQVADGHGAEVSSLVGAARDGVGMHGVAFDSTLLMLRTDLPNTCTPRCAVSLSDLGKALDIAISNGARVINLSMTFTGPLPAGFPEAIDRATAAGIVVVIAAGNQGSADAAPSSLLALQPEARGMMIVAGATNNAGTALASFSNRAGGSANAYLAAVGADVQVTDQDGNVVVRSGTSLSTPVISGAAALLAQAFPNLTGQQIVNLLLTTASDMGVPGTDPIYGRGALDLTAAFAPQGTMSLAGSMAPVAHLNDGVLSPAMGDASTGLRGAVFLDGYKRAYQADLPRTFFHAAPDAPLHASLARGYDTNAAALGPLAVSVVTMRDLRGPAAASLRRLGLSEQDARAARALAATAVMRLSPTTRVAFGFSENGRSLQQRLSNQYGNHFLVARDPIADNGFHGRSGVSLGLRHDFGPLALSVTSESGEVRAWRAAREFDRSGYRITSLVADRALGSVSFSLGGALLEEAASVLGGRLSSAFSGAGSRSWFADGAAALDFGMGWNVRASYRRGWTAIRGGNTLVMGGGLSSNAFAFDLARAGAFAPGDRLALRITQPLRVRAGGLNLNLPVSYDYASGEIGYQPYRLDLAPKGREMAYEIAYGTRFLGGQLAANAFLRTDPGNIDWMGNDVGGALRFTLGF